MDKNLGTLIAIGGTVAIGLGVIAYYAVVGEPLDVETIKLIVTGLLGFAAGGGLVLATKE